MIESINLKNFESHKSTKLQLSPGVNIISGQSDHGKSSIIRGIYLIRNNKPSGTSIVSFWNRDKKGNPIKSSFASVTLSNGIELKRERSQDFNGYMIGDTKLEAVGQTIPEDIEKSFNITDVNVQYQFDRPFLLDDSPADVARFFNKIIKLDLIDKVQSKAELMRRRLNGSIKDDEEAVLQLNEQITKFDWIESAERLVNKIEVMEQEIEQNTKAFKILTDLFDEYDECKEVIEQAKEIDRAQAFVIQIEELNNKIKENKNIYSNLMELYESYEDEKEAIELVKEIKDADKLVQNISELQVSIDTNRKLYGQLKALYDESIEMKVEVKKCSKEEVELIAMLPETCPTCGKPLDKENLV